MTDYNKIKRQTYMYTTQDLKYLSNMTKRLELGRLSVKCQYIRVANLRSQEPSLNGKEEDKKQQ